MKLATIAGLGVLATGMGLAFTAAQDTEFKWVNPLPDHAHERLNHGTFRSEAMGVDVGYVIYLPPGYEEAINAARRYPVVYWLHGGRLGSELRNILLAEDWDRQIRSGRVPPRIYVLVNGGRFGHYDYDGSLGETAFVRELIPHVDRTYRTVSKRSGRALEGFSAGGRGTARIMFKYPEVFCSGAPMGGGHQHEKANSEKGGVVRLGTESVVVDFSHNSWDLARSYARLQDAPPLEILVVVGTLDFNYEANLEWMGHLESLGIPFSRQVVPKAPHSAGRVYEKIGQEIMLFHERCFAR